ncbi:hypothetical protein INR49_021668, partial [Caranx melampygus]
GWWASTWTCRESRSGSSPSHERNHVGKAKGVLKNFLIEPFVPHAGDHVLFHHEGGVDVGDVDAKAQRLMVAVDDKLNEDQVKRQLLTLFLMIEEIVLASFYCGSLHLYEDLYFTYLEINPLIDATAITSARRNGVMWSFHHLLQGGLSRGGLHSRSDAKSGASLKLTLLNPRAGSGPWWLGEGLRDTICDLGGVDELANYGEYSVAPGIVRAIKDYQGPLKEHEVTIFVRRGGPNYQEGLRVMEKEDHWYSYPCVWY